VIGTGPRRLARATALVATGAALLLGISAGPAVASHRDRHRDNGSHVETPIVSDQPGVAPVTDPSLVNPWGISFAAIARAAGLEGARAAAL
jgi:hypothetical protein